MSVQLFLLVLLVHVVVGVKKSQPWQLEDDRKAMASIKFVPLSDGKTMADFLDDSGKVKTNRVSQNAGSAAKLAPFSFSCGFEEGVCGMTQKTDDQMDWTVQQGNTKSKNTGPSGAHGGKKYIYTEASGGKRRDTAIIASPKVPSAGDYCVEFWYHMLGRHIGSLTVATKDNGKYKEAFKEEADQGQNWHSGKVQVNLQAGGRVYFKGRRGRGYAGDMALDDITIKSC